MNIPFKILIVEDEMVIAANIALQLSSLGYEICGMLPTGEEALRFIKDNKPDLVLMDIQLKGTFDGIETAHFMQKQQNTPVIYLTANTDDAHFARAKETNPLAFLSKPFRKQDVQRAVELAVNRIMAERQPAKVLVDQFVLSDRIFVRHQDKMVKVFIEDIYYVEADRNYCRIFAKNGDYLLVMTLKDIEEKLPATHFYRVHRSYLVNLSSVDEVAATHLVAAGKVIPFAKSSREDLLKRITMV